MLAKRTLPLLLSVVALAACADDRPLPPYHGPATPTPRALWAEFQALHESANAANIYSSGRRMDALLTESARAKLTRTTSPLRDMVPPERRMAPDVVRQHMLGDNVLARRASIARSTLRSVDLLDATHATLVVEAGPDLALRLPITLERSDWRFESSRDLLASLDEVMPFPSSPAGHARFQPRKTSPTASSRRSTPIRTSPLRSP